MRIGVLKNNPDVFLASVDPDQGLAEAVLIFSAVSVAFLVVVGQNGFAWFCSLGLLISVVSLAAEHRNVCRLDKKTDVLSWSEGGYLGGRLLRVEKIRKVSEIVCVEMRPCSSRWVTRFQIRLEMKNGEKIPMTLCALRFSECLEKAGEVNAFLGLSEGPRVNDGTRFGWM